MKITLPNMEEDNMYKEPQDPPRPELKWKRVAELLSKHEDAIQRVTGGINERLFQEGVKNYDFKSLIAVGYALALEENGLDDWNKPQGWITPKPDPAIIANEAYRMLPDSCKEIMGKTLERTWKESLVADIKYALNKEKGGETMNELKEIILVALRRNQDNAFNNFGDPIPCVASDKFDEVADQIVDAVWEKQLLKTKTSKRRAV